MQAQRTLTILKPDSVQSRHVGDIISRFEKEEFRIVAAKKMQLSEAQARAFYEVHKARPFYDSLVKYMTSGPVWVLVLERSQAVIHLRMVMGNTDPAKADAGTIRKSFGESIERNCIHGSDSPENAEKEIGFFFAECDLA